MTRPSQQNVGGRSRVISEDAAEGASTPFDDSKSMQNAIDKLKNIRAKKTSNVASAND